MHKLLICKGFSLLALAWPALAWAANHAGHTPACASCGQKTYGTSVEWVANPSAAAQQAKKQEKLVFVLHVSGNFEDPGVT